MSQETVEMLMRLSVCCGNADSPSRQIDFSIAKTLGLVPLTAEMGRDGIAWSRGLGREIDHYTARVDHAMRLIPMGFGWALEVAETKFREGIIIPEAETCARVYCESIKSGVFACSPALALTGASLRARAEWLLSRMAFDAIEPYGKRQSLRSASQGCDRVSDLY